MVALIGMLVAAGAGSYLIYRQLQTESVVIDATPQFVQANDGSMCGTVDFVLEPRTRGFWWLRVEKDTMISGAITIAGNDMQDIGLRVFNPADRLVLFEPERQHNSQFELPAEVRGDYRFEFDNRHSMFTDKEITVSVCLT